MTVLGIDIGGSGIKGALVDDLTGELTTDRYRLTTPDKAKPGDVAAVVGQVAQHFNWTGPMGVGFPGVIQRGRVFTAANVHKSWIGTDAALLFQETTGNPTVMINDADAAGLAEMKFGAGRDYQDRGVVIVLTLGTGIGSAVFTSGRLVPNTEFGHLDIRGKDAEKRASDLARLRDELSWREWATRLNEFLRHLEILFWPDLIILGGGISKVHEKYFAYLETRALILPALMRNQAGIVGAAMAAAEKRLPAG